MEVGFQGLNLYPLGSASVAPRFINIHMIQLIGIAQARSGNQVGLPSLKWQPQPRCRLAKFLLAARAGSQALVGPERTGAVLSVTAATNGVRFIETVLFGWTVGLWAH